MAVSDTEEPRTSPLAHGHDSPALRTGDRGPLTYARMMLHLRPTSFGLVGLLAVSGLIASCASAAPASDPGSSGVEQEARLAGVRVTWQSVFGGLSQPTQVLAAPDGSNRMFVVEKPGTVRIWQGERLLSKPYLNIKRVVLNEGEGGLLSLAFDPRFRATHRLWVTYSQGNGNLVLARLRAPGPGARHVSRNTLRKVLTVEHKENRNHYGGQLMFGPDGYLYLGTGDGGGSGDPYNAAQDKDSLKGKILRLDVRRSCGAKEYCVPRSNPYAGSSRGRGEIWLRGLRNPWRFSFDPRTRALWVGDVGQDAYEEVTVVPGQPKRRNLGWSCYEAKSVYNASRCGKRSTYLGPDVVVPHPRGESVTGGFVYRGSRYASLMAGRYVFGDFVTARVWVYRPGGRTMLQSQRLGSEYAGPSSFGVDDRGEIWAVTYGGGLYRMKVTAR